jgi:DNA-binding response OmpR family regulator
VSKILIVDDDLTVTELLKILMQMAGHSATTVNDSTKAIEIARSADPDLITLDLMMPKLTGFELCELLHQDPKFGNTPIVIISAKDDSESKDRAIGAGAKDYVTKPFEADDLIRRIEKLTRAQTLT